MNSCFTDQMLELEQAQTLIEQAIKPISRVESLPIHKAKNRILAKPVLAAVSVPPHRNSAMDGYALPCDIDNTLAVGQTFEVIGKSLAGAPLTQPPKDTEGTAVRIMTGACVPNGYETVVMQEQTEVKGGQITLLAPVKYDQNIRHPGEDIDAGTEIYAIGHRINAFDIGVLASVGIEEVLVYPPVKVALLCTGDELKHPGEALGEGDIYNSNLYALTALLSDYPVEIIDFGIIPDDENHLEETLSTASQQADVILSTGGVSVGDADYVKRIMDKIGKVGFWKVAIKPGKPFAFGQFNHAMFFGLPGNPVSSLVTFKLLVASALLKMAGYTGSYELTFYKATVAADILKKTGRTEFQRGLLHHEDGQLHVTPLTGQGSHQLSALAAADCLIRVEKNISTIQQGEIVDIMLLNN